MTILVAILGLILLIVIHELGHMLTAKAFGVRVPEFGIGFGPPIFKKQFGKTLYSFRIILLGGFAKIAGMPGDDDEGPDTYYAKAPWKRALMIFAGPAVNLVFAALIFSAVFMIQGVPTSPNPQPEAEVRSVATGSMASDSGLQSGDELVAVGGQTVQSWEEFTGAIRERSPGDEVAITVERDGQERKITGELGSAANDPDQAQVGITPSIGEVTHSPFVALWEGSQRTVQFIGIYISGLVQLVTGELNFFENVSGPVGITTISSEAISTGVYSALGMLAIVSMILGVMNLLPVLPLDGGHLLMLLIEKIQGKPVTEATMGKIATVGIMLFLTLMLFATYADISKIITGTPFIPQ
jgi:regulator of sigma E protease